MKYLGIDYGTKRIGIAISDDGGRMAFPKVVVPSGPHALSAIDELVRTEQVETIVVGESRDFSGEWNPVMEDIEQFVADIGELTHVPVVYEAEFFTSAQASRQFTPGDSRKKNPEHTNLDASAAALILQSYIDRQNRGE